MASGFIILEDGRSYARRYTTYDIIINAVINELGDEKEDELLKSWLLTRIPVGDEDKDYIEMGWGFIRNSDEACVNRTIDDRNLKENFKKLFLEKALQAAEQAKNEGRFNNLMLNCFTDFAQMIILAKEGAPAHEFTDTAIFELEDKKEGPGW